MIAQLNNFIGELAALTAALLWAISSVIYSRLGLKIPPLQLNFYKGIIAIAFILLTLSIQGAAFTNLSFSTIALLTLSGIIGIGLGDTAYFAALNSLGARRTLLLETSSPPMGALLALIFIGEQLSLSVWCGILLTIIGIAWVISERNPVDNISVSRQGIIWGILAAIAQAVGAVISRFALLQSDISPLESTLIRLVGGTVIVVGLLFLPVAKQTEVKWQLSGRSLGIIARQFVAEGSLRCRNCRGCDRSYDEYLSGYLATADIPQICSYRNCSNLFSYQPFVYLTHSGIAGRKN